MWRWWRWCTMADQALFERHPLPWVAEPSSVSARSDLECGWVVDANGNDVLSSAWRHPDVTRLLVNATEMAARMRELLDERDALQAQVARLRADVDHWEQKAVARGVRIGELEDAVRGQAIEIRELRGAGGRCGGGL